MSGRNDMTLPEAASRLRVSVATVRRWIDTQALPARRVGRTIRIPRLDFEAWYSAHALRRGRAPSDGAPDRIT